MRDTSVAGTMPCRRCRVEVEVSESALAQHEAFNALLRKRGQPPTPRDQVVECDRCREEQAEKRAAANLEVVERMAAAVRVLKAGIGGSADGEVVTAGRHRAAVAYLNEHDNEKEPKANGKGESRTVIYWREQHRRKKGGGGQVEW
jgi:hypothetical protein